MNRNLLKSGLLSVGVHAALMIPVAVGAAGWIAPSADLLSGVSSVELDLVESEWRPSAPVAPVAEPEEGEEEAPAYKTPPAPPQEIWLNDRGALTNPAGSLRNPAPVYPRIARVLGWQGTVLVRAWVTPSGQAASVCVAQGSGREMLDRAAMNAVQGWTFRPARRNGQAVASLVEVPITFRLEKETGQPGRDR